MGNYLIQFIFMVFTLITPPTAKVLLGGQVDWIEAVALEVAAGLIWGQGGIVQSQEEVDAVAKAAGGADFCTICEAKAVCRAAAPILGSR